MRYLGVIPAYNEALHIEEVIRGVWEETRDVLVVNDGSTDSTEEVLKALGVEYVSQERGGKGAALRRGFDYALEGGFDGVVTLDGDGQHDTSEFPRFIEKLMANGTDMVVGTRMDDTSEMPVVRLLTNKGMSGLVSGLAGVKMPDTQCGYRAISSKLLREVELETRHYDTESEMLIKAAKAGFHISFVPIRVIYRNGSHSSINKVVDTVRFWRLLIKEFIKGRRGDGRENGRSGD